MTSNFAIAYVQASKKGLLSFVYNGKKHPTKLTLLTRKK